MFARPPMVPGEARLPWDDPAFSARMLQEHLDDRHDLASRRSSTIDAHVERLLVTYAPRRVLDLGCGPGLYLERLAANGCSCVGVDVSPAAIEYASARASSSCRYVEGDFRSLRPEGEFDLVLCLFGELSTVPIDEVEAVLSGVAAALAAGGRAVIEVSTLAGVRGKGDRPARWYPGFGGLFGDGSHLVLEERRWFEAEAASVERWWIVDADGSEPRRLGSTTWWHGLALDEVLDRVGLRIVGRFGDVAGAPHDDAAEFETLVLARARGALEA